MLYQDMSMIGDEIPKFVTSYFKNIFWYDRRRLEFFKLDLDVIGSYRYRNEEIAKYLETVPEEFEQFSKETSVVTIYRITDKNKNKNKNKANTLRLLFCRRRVFDF